MSKKTIISLIPHLITLEGHQYVYHQVFQKAVPFAYRAHIPIHSQIEPLPPQWEKSFQKSSAFKLLTLLRRFKDFCTIFKRCSKESERYFFLETFNTLDLLALVLAAKISSKKNDRFWLLLRYENKKSLFRFLLRLHPFVLLTDSELIQKKQKASLLPIAHAEVTQKHAPLTPTAKPLCLWIGEPRIAKGLFEIDALLKTPGAEDFSFALSRHALFEKYGPKVDLIERHIPSEEFYGYLSHAAVVLLPYDPEMYSVSTSGIFVETITYGKIPLVKKGSWLSFELEKYNLEELIVDWSNPHFFSYLKNLLGNTKVMHNLKAMQKEYGTFHSLETLQEKIIQLAK